MSTRLSINDFPAEIMGMIFLEFVEQSESHLPQTLVAVCRSWKDWVEENPRLWSRIIVEMAHGEKPMELEPYKTRILKAKQSPLAIYIYSRPMAESAAITRDVLSS